MSDDRKRELKARAQYLHRATDLERRHAKALAWREAGYSHQGIADKVGSSKSTVAGWLDRVAAQYGPAAVETKSDVQRDDDLEEITHEELMEYPEETREWWISVAEDNPGAVPAQFSGGEIDV